MVTTKRKFGLLAAFGAVLALTPPYVATTASTASTASTGYGGTPLVWGACEGRGLDPRQQCATVDVPLDHSEPGPGGERIGIAVSRIPAEEPEARRGVLLMIAGGPGGGSLDEISGKGQRLPQEVRNAYDLVGFDPRGVGRSAPVSCGLDREDLATTRFWPWPAADGSVAGNMATARRTAAACDRNGGELIRHIGTADNARDLDLVRAALGERRLSAWGVSYGAYLGAVYRELFPHRTDRFVLDSNPDGTGSLSHGDFPRGMWAGFEGGVEDAFPEFAEWASRDGNPYRLAPTADGVRDLFLRLAGRLDREPLPWPGAAPAELNGNVLRQAMVYALYGPDDFPGLAELIRAAQRGETPPAPEQAPEPFLQNALAVALATFCNDGDWPRSSAVYQAAVDRSRAEHPLTAGMPRNATACAAWPSYPKPDPVRITDRGRSAVLLVQNERDPATPLAGARAVRAALGGRAVMVTVGSTGHEVYLAQGNACGDGAVTRYLTSGRRPARDMHCP
ncbi:alpha/beta hydrolase [Streptomyces sp. 8P21H-1]|uniref:alpha/beta hydrolase n=1 Tax=Streptomyces sp. 8P21H-1 TaxID=2737048 RepID=UPI0020C637F4|nr:alpha/beta hydrolase [Streptomyces sp. 8P21H-1]